MSLVTETNFTGPTSSKPGGTGPLAVLGLGYVGLPTALNLHAAGLPVLGVDISDVRLQNIRFGTVDLIPSDRARLDKALAEPETFLLTADPDQLSRAEAVVISVPTPITEYLQPDLRFVASACETVVRHARRGQTLILTSTSYVGCTRDLLIRPLQERGLIVGEDVFVAFSPERIDPANTTYEQRDIPRVLGGATSACADRGRSVLDEIARNIHVVSSPEAAELTKLFENTFRAANISLANELTAAANNFDLDVTEVIDAAATKPFGFMAFKPGPGVGGHCIPCDPHYLLWQLRKDHVPTPVIQAAMEDIAARPSQVVARAQRVMSDAGRGLADSRTLVVGVAYKPGVEDVRESPALEIIRLLEDTGAKVDFQDPRVRLLQIGGTMRIGVGEVAYDEYDLVLVHTRDPELDAAGIRASRLVLDATYTLPRGGNVHWV